MQRLPLWRHVMLGLTLLLGILFALPNLYGFGPAIRLSGPGVEESQTQWLTLLEQAEVAPVAIERENHDVLLHFTDVETQLKAHDALEGWRTSHPDHLVTLELSPRAPSWLLSLGAKPMTLGLDLQGGVHFLMEVDLQPVLTRRATEAVREMARALRQRGIPYEEMVHHSTEILIRLQQEQDRDAALQALADQLAAWQPQAADPRSPRLLRLTLEPDTLEAIQRNALEQNMTTLRHRIDELGVAEPVVQRQGSSAIVVELPGIQDTTAAKNIIGATATIAFHLVDTQHSPTQAQSTGLVPPGSLLEQDRQGRPILLQREVIVSGDQLINAVSSMDPTTASPAVLVTLNSQGARRMAAVTQSNIGKPMAVVYMEYKPIETPPGAPVAHRLEKRVISVATIQSAFSSRFQITGLDRQEAHTLALLLRAGSLAAPLQIVEERTVGPSLGQANVQRGLLASTVGTALVLLFMAVYYRAFGLIADAAMLLNLVLLVGLLSLLGVTLTLPGIAGIVLTLGMAVDANVLINERIREELDGGLTPQASIRAGYQRAFATIIDSNLTTLIAALILFSIGTGPIKGFAVTLSAGIATSMFSAVFGSRALVDLIFGSRRLKSLPI